MLPLKGILLHATSYLLIAAYYLLLSARYLLFNNYSSEGDLTAYYLLLTLLKGILRLTTFYSKRNAYSSQGVLLLATYCLLFPTS